MAVWRTKAYGRFGFKAGDYSYARGKAELFADLVEMASRMSTRFPSDSARRKTVMRPTGFRTSERPILSEERTVLHCA